MKKTYLNSFCARCLTLLVLALLSTNLAWGESYTITFKTATSDGSTEIGSTTKTSTVISEGEGYVSSFTSNCSKAYYSGKNGVKLGSNSAAGTLEFNIASDYQKNIKKITVVSAKYSNDTGTLALYSGSTQLESGKTPGTDFTHTFATATTVSSIKLTTSDKRAYITSITLETEETPTPTEAYTVTLGDTKTELPESAPGTGVVLPSRSAVGDYKFEGWCETNVEETTTSPTIIPAGNYQPSKNITLYPVYSKTISGTVSNDFQLVTGTPSDWSGEYIIVNSDKAYAMSCKFREGTSGEFLAKTISITDNTITSTDNEIIWTIEAGSTDGQYSIKNKSTETYANISGTSSTNAALSTEPIYFTFESSSTSNVWKVVSVTNSARCFSYYGTNTSFRTYAKSNNNTGYLYKRKADGEVTYYVTLLPKNVEITAAGWATACLPFNATVTSDNATAYYVTTSGSTLNKVEANVVPAGEGVLLKSNNGGAATVTFTPSTATADVVEANYMKGSVAGETFSADGYKYYILANDATKGLGFYFKVEGGASVECAAGKAVLAVPNSASPAKEGFPFDEESTGISESMVNGQSTAVYNLNGMQVDKNYNGIVIMNGKKYINK